MDDAGPEGQADAIVEAVERAERKHGVTPQATGYLAGHAIAIIRSNDGRVMIDYEDGEGIGVQAAFDPVAPDKAEWLAGLRWADETAIDEPARGRLLQTAKTHRSGPALERGEPGRAHRADDRRAAAHLKKITEAVEWAARAERQRWDSTSIRGFLERLGKLGATLRAGFEEDSADPVQVIIAAQLGDVAAVARRGRQRRPGAGDHPRKHQRAGIAHRNAGGRVGRPRQAGRTDMDVEPRPAGADGIRVDDGRPRPRQGEDDRDDESRLGAERRVHRQAEKTTLDRRGLETADDGARRSARDVVDDVPAGGDDTERAQAVRAGRRAVNADGLESRERTEPERTRHRSARTIRAERCCT